MMATHGAPQPNTVWAEFNAGKLNWDGRKVTPDKRKGKLLILQGEDGLTHVQWVNRQNDAVEDDLIVINDAYLQRIPEAVKGRVYVLRFTSSDKKMLFWLQYPDETRDEQNVRKFNDAAGGVPSARTVNVSGTNESQTTSSAGAASSPLLPTPISQGVLSQLLQQYTRNIAPAAPPQQSVPLSTILTTENLLNLVDDPIAAAELQTFLPEGQGTLEDMRDAIRSPPLRSCLNSLTQAIYSDQLPVLLVSMGLDASSSSTSGSREPMETLVDLLCTRGEDNNSNPKSSDSKEGNKDLTEGNMDGKKDDNDNDVSMEP